MFVWAKLGCLHSCVHTCCTLNVSQSFVARWQTSLSDTASQQGDRLLSLTGADADILHPVGLLTKVNKRGSFVNQPTTCELASRLGRWLKGDKITIKAGQIRWEHVKDATQTEALVEMSDVWPLHARGLCVTHILTRDFWYYAMWNLNASSGRGAQRSGWKLKDDLASSETEMETCRRLERVVTLQAVHHRPRVLGQSLNSSGPAGGGRSRVCWRKQKQSVWGRLHEAVNWTVAMLLDLLQTVLNKTFTPFYTNLQSSCNLSHVIASVGRFESLRKNILSDPDGCSMLVDLKILLWETNSTDGCFLFFVFLGGGGGFRGQMLPNIFQFCTNIWKHLMLPWSKTQTFHLTLLMRRMWTDLHYLSEPSQAGCISAVKWKQQMSMFHITRLPFLVPQASSQRLMFHQTDCQTPVLIKSTLNLRRWNSEAVSVQTERNGIFTATISSTSRLD